MATMDSTFQRYLYKQIDWQNRAICVCGARGVGKTTLMCQYYLNNFDNAEKALYLSADNIHVLSQGLLSLASEYFSLGGEALLIDEVHKYPDWSIEIKNILDTYPKKQIIFSGSAAMELKRSKADLSRRVLYYEMPGLSFREYLIFIDAITLEPMTLNEILTQHIKLAGKFKTVNVLKLFHDYLKHGYYPYFLENQNSYLVKLNNVIEKVIMEDIPSTKSIRQGTITQLKKILWLIATSICLVPNVDKISKNLGITREIVYDCLEYLAQSGLTQNVYATGKGMRLIRKPGKIFLDNCNLLYALNDQLALESGIGPLRETFFVNQLSTQHAINVHDSADFLVDNEWIFEVGGLHKTTEQIKALQNAYLAVDGIQVGFGNKIPLYLFGCLY
ncbi:MAG: hypothetical protein A3F17_01925 [Gammaproteobacteria bacterium RIFCSPHIGHO2_12_FULL_41_15]|nr:MAG: hypothetical protein A3F17_01925 [Gammaproteobacteria bacterium RIFCSPHIGHO2_12_FULL_41_15]